MTDSPKPGSGRVVQVLEISTPSPETVGVTLLLVSLWNYLAHKISSPDFGELSFSHLTPALRPLSPSETDQAHAGSWWLMHPTACCLGNVRMRACSTAESCPALSGGL